MAKLSKQEEEFCELFELEEELEYPDNTTVYPDLTDTIYLELISILTGVTKLPFAFVRSIEELKQETLELCFFYKKDIFNQVQNMFRRY